MSYKINPLAYPIVIRVINGYVEVSQPDLELYRVRGRFGDFKRREEIGAAVMDLWSEIAQRHAAGSLPDLKPSTPKSAVKGSAQSLSLGQVAALLKVNIQTVRRMCQAGKLDAYRTAGGHWKVTTQDATLRRFLPMV